MKTVMYVAGAMLLAACAQTSTQTTAESARQPGETCRDWAQRTAPFNPQTAATLEQNCLRERAG